MCDRLQVAEPAVDGGAQVAGVVAARGRVPAVSDDVRQLPEVARVLERGGHARQVAARRLRGTTLVPSLLNCAISLPRVTCERSSYIFHVDLYFVLL